jgi:hypothetical protein
MVCPGTGMGEGLLFNKYPLTHSRTRQHRAALSRKGRGHNNADRTRGFLWRHHQQHTLHHSRGALLRPGFCIVASLTRIEGGRSAEKRSGACEAPVGRALGASQDARERAYDAARQALARRLASHDAGRSPLGAPPWRFFTRGRASVSGIASGSVQRAPRRQVVVPGGRLPGPPGASGYKPPPQDATPRSAFRIVSRTRPQ